MADEQDLNGQISQEKEAELIKGEANAYFKGILKLVLSNDSLKMLITPQES